MKQKLLEALKAKFPGVNAAVLSRIADKFAKTATTEEQVTTAVAGVTQEIIDIYRKRWEIELLFKQDQTEFPLEILLWRKRECHQDTDLGDAYSESAAYGNVMRKGLSRSWSFSGLATMIRITLMYYVDYYSLFNHPEKDWEALLEVEQQEYYQLSLF